MLETASLARPPRILYQPALPLRVWRKLRIVGECWRWTGAMQSAGYGAVKVDGKAVLVHRFVYEKLKGPIPNGTLLDHLCHNRWCARPAHLEPVSNHENTMRGERWRRPWNHAMKGESDGQGM